MDPTHILGLLEQLDDEIDDLEEALEPITKTALLETASKLPLLDKAKLHVLVTYAIESILFSYLRLHGVKARDHPVFRELTRVKQYFDKIKLAENPVEATEKSLGLDKSAARRFIAAGLSGNDQYDLARAEQTAKERAKAHIKFLEVTSKRTAEKVSKDSEATSSSESDSEEVEKAKKKVKTAIEPAKKEKHKAKSASKSHKKSNKNKKIGRES